MTRAGERLSQLSRSVRYQHDALWLKQRYLAVAAASPFVRCGQEELSLQPWTSQQELCKIWVPPTTYGQSAVATSTPCASFVSALMRTHPSQVYYTCVSADLPQELLNKMHLSRSHQRTRRIMQRLTTARLGWASLRVWKKQAWNPTNAILSSPLALRHSQCHITNYSMCYLWKRFS